MNPWRWVSARERSGRPLADGAAGAPAPAPASTCGACRHFEARAEVLERLLPGTAVFSSGYGAVRADDGICAPRQRHLTATHHCEWFSAR